MNFSQVHLLREDANNLESAINKVEKSIDQQSRTMGQLQGKLRRLSSKDADYVSTCAPSTNAYQQY